MKNYWTFAAMIPLLIISSCRKEDPGAEQGTGLLHLEVGMSINIKEEPGKLKAVQGVEDFRVIIFESGGSPHLSFDRAGDIPAQIELAPGQYYVEAFSDNDLPAEFENPFYRGVSDPFTITSNTEENVLVQCELANTMVSVHYSDKVTSSFSDYSTTVSSHLGSLVYGRTESRMGYFRTLPLGIVVDLSYMDGDGTMQYRIIRDSIPQPLSNRHYELHIDASVVEGLAAFQILLDSVVEEVLIVDITEDTTQQPPQIGDITPGELIITEIMANPTALSDTEGEWFELFNSSERDINLQNLILGRNGSDRHTITDSIILTPGDYYVMSRTAQATDVINQYIYGTDILLANTGAELTIFNAGTETIPGPVIFSVNYGNSGFPTAAGASITLSPDHLNAADALLGTNWCTSSSEFGAGDLGTPGTANDPCQ